MTILIIIPICDPQCKKVSLDTEKINFDSFCTFYKHSNTGHISNGLGHIGNGLPLCHMNKMSSACFWCVYLAVVVFCLAVLILKNSRQETAESGYNLKRVVW